MSKKTKNCQTDNKENQQNEKKIILKECKITIVIIFFCVLIFGLLLYLISNATSISKFSLEVSETDEGNLKNLNRTFKIYNVGGQIVNPKVTPIIQLELSCAVCNEYGEPVREGTVLIGFSDYFSEDYSYNNAESAFIISETKANELYDLIDRIDNLLKGENDCINLFSIKYYFKISYHNYKGAKNEKILYPESNYAQISYIDGKRERYLKDNKLNETKSVKEENILVPIDFKDKNGLITINHNKEEAEILYIEAGEKPDKYISSFITDYLEKYSVELDIDDNTYEVTKKKIDNIIVDDNKLLIGYIEKHREPNAIIIILLVMVLVISSIIVTLIICLSAIALKEPNTTYSEYEEYLLEKLKFKRDKAEDAINRDNKSSESEINRDVIAEMIRNNRGIGEYFKISKSQEEISYKMSIACAVIGITMLGMAVLTVVFKSGVTTTVISIVSGASMEIISGIVLWIHDKSASQLNHYYNALHENEKFLSAINLADKLDSEKKSQMYMKIIKAQIGVSKEEQNIESEEKKNKV